MDSRESPLRSRNSAALVLGPGVGIGHADSAAANHSPSSATAGAGVASAALAEPHQGLVLAAQRGDERAFTSLIEIYQQTVYGYLRARLFDATDADDLCQETFIRCYQGREKLARATQVGPWLIGIARNLLREHIKRVHRRREVAWTELCLELDELVPDRHEKQSESLGNLPQCMEALGPSARQAIDFRYRSQFKMAEIAELLRRSEGAVRLLVHRARLALKQCLESRLSRNSKERSE